MELEQNREAFQKMGVGIAAVSYDSVAILRDFADRKGIHYPLLSDPDSKLIREAGLLNESVPKDNLFFGIPYPGTFILDANGVIVRKYFEDDYKQRYTSADILVGHYGASPAAGRETVEGKQLKAATSASNRAVHPLQRVALVIDIDLKPGMHVYAPGVTGYIPIEWKLKDGLAEAHETIAPKPDILFLKAIDEKVPVFHGQFRLTRDITLAGDQKLKSALDASGDFAVEGTLRYQACDDRVCYVPQELPLKWTFHYEGFDRERAPAAIMHKAR